MVVFYFVLIVFLIVGSIAVFSPEKIRDLNIRLYQKMPGLYKDILIKLTHHPIVLFAVRLSGIIILGVSLFMIYLLITNNI